MSYNYDFLEWSDVKFDNIMSGRSSLVCPKCGIDFTHHGNVTIINRDVEDADGTRIIVSEKTANIEPIEKKWIIGRRNCIVIDMTCENGCAFCLLLIQHKGSTMIKYV